LCIFLSISIFLCIIFKTFRTGSSPLLIAQTLPLQQSAARLFQQGPKGRTMKQNHQFSCGNPQENRWWTRYFDFSGANLVAPPTTRQPCISCYGHCIFPVDLTAEFSIVTCHCFLNVLSHCTPTERRHFETNLARNTEMISTANPSRQIPWYLSRHNFRQKMEVKLRMKYCHAL